MGNKGQELKYQNMIRKVKKNVKNHFPYIFLVLSLAHILNRKIILSHIYFTEMKN